MRRSAGRGARHRPTAAVSWTWLAILLTGSALHYARGYYSPFRASGQAQGADEAYVSYRYGWNLAHYRQLSWNESGYRRTEGFTNPLWVYLSAGWALLGDKDAVYPLMAASSVVVAGALFALLSWAVARGQGRGELAAWRLDRPDGSPCAGGRSRPSFRPTCGAPTVARRAGRGRSWPGRSGGS